MEGLVAKGVAEAKQYIQQKRRERALLALRKNKLYEQNLDKIDAYLLNVEQVRRQILLQRAPQKHLEGVGIVVAIGEHTQDSPVKLGDRVGIKWLAYSCLDCEACRKGLEQGTPIIAWHR